MKNESRTPKKSIISDLIFWSRRLQAGFIALVLVLATVFIYQYWQDLSKNPLILTVKAQTDIAVFELNMPERLISNSNGITSEIKLITNPSGNEILNPNNVIIEFSSDNPNINFEPKQIILPKSELEKGENSYTVKVTSLSNLQGEKIDFNISITNPDGTKVSFKKILPVENTLKNPYVFIAALLSFISAILSFVIQTRNLRTK